MEHTNYEIKYRHIYIKTNEYIASIKDVSIYRDTAIPLVKRIIRNYTKFKVDIADMKERRGCDEYIESLKRLVNIMTKKVKLYEKISK